MLFVGCGGHCQLSMVVAGSLSVFADAHRCSQVLMVGCWCCLWAFMPILYHGGWMLFMGDVLWLLLVEEKDGTSHLVTFTSCST